MTILTHIEKVFNELGLDLQINQKGIPIASTSLVGKLSFECEPFKIPCQLAIQMVIFDLPAPYPHGEGDEDGNYTVNRIRVSKSLINDYNDNHPFTDDELEKQIMKNTMLFGFYNN
jgi:hypothetical protein